jgi:phenylacetate-CoA ligase
MTVRVEHPEHAAPDSVVEAVSNAISSRIELRVGVEVLAPSTLPKTEFKAKRVLDKRNKG